MNDLQNCYYYEVQTYTGQAIEETPVHSRSILGIKTLIVSQAPVPSMDWWKSGHENVPDITNILCSCTGKSYLHFFVCSLLIKQFIVPSPALFRFLFAQIFSSKIRIQNKVFYFFFISCLSENWAENREKFRKNGL